MHNTHRKGAKQQGKDRDGVTPVVSTREDSNVVIRVEHGKGCRR